MNEGTNAKIFRGECECSAVSAINAVEGLDISKLAEKHDGAPGEATIYVFPVRSQLTWFRAKNATGLIETEILFEDEYRAKVKATVYDTENKKLATGHGTANIQDDARFANKLVETAESRAISRALDNAGFGCQLSAKTYDAVVDGAFNDPVSTGEEDNKGMPAMPGEALTPASMPDKINSSKMVDANATSQPDDISTLSDGDSSDTEKQLKPPRRSRQPTQKKSDEQTAQETLKGTPQGVESSAGEQEPPAAAVASEDEAEKEAALPDEEKQIDDKHLIADTLEDDASRKPESKKSSDNLAAFELAGKTVEEMMFTAIQKMDDIQPDGFDPAYFGEGPVDPAAFYINRKSAATGIKNGDLQKAINFFTQNQELLLDVVFVTKNEAVNGKTIREIIAMGDFGERSIFTWSYAYTGDKLALQAATLVYYQNTPDLWRWEQRPAS